MTIPPVFGVGLLLAAALVAYIPLTHMSHFIAKYFTYHNIRWDDAPNMKGSTIEAKIAQNLTYRPTWSAAHMGAGGVRIGSMLPLPTPMRLWPRWRAKARR